MNEITIGRLGPDWKPSSVARYYAERGNDGDYAFGSTPVEALVRLEAREAAAKSKFDGDLAEEIAFLALGADEFLKEHRSTNLGSCGGYMGFIAEVIRHAPMLAEYSNLISVEPQPMKLVSSRKRGSGQGLQSSVA